MRAIRFFVTGALLLALAGGTLSSACASDCWFGRHARWYQHPFSHYAYRLGNVPTPPYYAIHPPVYYGKRVGMPYGNSPMTRPPRPVMHGSPRPQERQSVQGVMIENPFVKKDTVAGDSTKEAISFKPKIIVTGLCT